MFLKSDYRRRLRAVQSGLGDLDALLVLRDENLRYLTGLESGRLLVWESGAKFILNPVYNGLTARAPVRPIAQKKDLVKRIVLSKRFKKVGVDDISLRDYKAMDPKLRRAIRPSEVCEELRKIKSKGEIKLIARASKIAADVTRAVEESQITGVSEFELAAAIECEIRRSGSDSPPFSDGMLCMSGPNSAYPHAPLTNRRIRKGDLVIIDLGAVCDGYHSDMTRTLMVGEVPKQKFNLVGFVDWLKEEAIDRIELGGKISEIHEYINKEIAKKGYKFAHLSGHGVGLEIHEKPSVGPGEKDVFQEGMVFTIEPGIYATKYGARSEDTIALVGKKKRVLTK